MPNCALKRDREREGVDGGGGGVGVLYLTRVEIFDG